MELKKFKSQLPKGEKGLDNTIGKTDLDIKNYDTFAEGEQAKIEQGRLSEYSQGSAKSNYSVTKPDSEFFHALLNFTKSFIGIGPLTIAAAMVHAGVILGLIGIITCGLLCLYGVNIMVLSRRKILKDRAANDPGLNYLPNAENDLHRQPRNEDEDEDLDVEEDVPIRYSLDSRTYTDRIIHDHHKLKTYSDLARECFGEIGFFTVTLVIFVQQITIVTAYFFFLDKVFPSYIVLIVMAPICMF